MSMNRINKFSKKTHKFRSRIGNSAEDFSADIVTFEDDFFELKLELVDNSKS